MCVPQLWFSSQGSHEGSSFKFGLHAETELKLRVLLSQNLNTQNSLQNLSQCPFSHKTCHHWSFQRMSAKKIQKRSWLAEDTESFWLEVHQALKLTWKLTCWRPFWIVNLDWRGWTRQLKALYPLIPSVNSKAVIWLHYVKYLIYLFKKSNMLLFAIFRLFAPIFLLLFVFTTATFHFSNLVSLLIW